MNRKRFAVFGVAGGSKRGLHFSFLTSCGPMLAQKLSQVRLKENLGFIV